MARETEQLVVSLEARVRDFERNFQRASRTANDNFGRIEKRAKQSGDVMEKSIAGASSRVAGIMKNFGVGFAGGILGGLSVAGLQQIVGSIHNVASGVAMIGSNAKKAGLSNKSFQELSYVASQSRIDVDALADGMKELALRADEWIVTGTGPGAEAFKRLGYSAADLKDRLKDPSALLVDIIVRLQQLDKAAQIRVSDEVFGGSAGERFVELLGRGAEGIRAMISEANEFGLVLSDDVIAKADEIDRKFDLISKTISTKMKGAIVGMTGDLLGFLDRLKGIEEQQSTTLGNRMTELGMRRLQNENEILKLKGDKESTIGGALLGPVFDKQIEKLEKETAEISATEARILKVLEERSNEAGSKVAEAVPDITKLNTTIRGTKPATDAAAKGMQSYSDAIRALKGEIPELAEEVAKLDARAKIDKAYNAALKNATSIGQTNQAYALRQQALASIGKDIPGKGGVTDTTDDAKAKAREQIEAYASIIAGAREIVTSQQQEASALGMTKDAAAAYRYEQEMLNEARREGLQLSPQQRQEISQYAQGMANAERITQQYNQSQEDAAELSKFFGESAVDALEGIASGSMTAMDALRQLVAALARMALQAAFLGEGPLAGSLKGTGGLFGGLGRQLSSTVSPAAMAAATGSPAPAIASATEQTFAAPVGEVTRKALTPVQAVQPVAEAARAPVGNAFDFLMKRTDKPASHINGLNADFQERLTGLMQDPNAPDGLGIYSGFRSVDRQRELWKEALKKYGSADEARKWVAPPGKSNHGFGQAADLSFNGKSLKQAPPDVVDWAHQNAERYGLKFPLGNENWHVEMQETRGGKPFGGMPMRNDNPMNLRPPQTVPPGIDTMSTGSIAAEQTQQQAQAIQQQIEDQRRLAQQMQATQQATQSMQMPIQNIGQAATQVVPNLGGMTQGMSGLLSPLMQAVPGLGQFGGAITQLLQLLMSGVGGGGIFSLFGFADGGHVSGPGTSRSDSIPAMLSDGEFVVNAGSTKKHRAVLEAINAGRAPAIASGGLASKNAFSSSQTYAPSLAFHMGSSSGSPKQDARFAQQVASAVDSALKANQPDTFRRTEGQHMGELASKLRRDGGRHS